MPKFTRVAGEAEKLLAMYTDLPADVRDFLHGVVSCSQDMARYQHLRVLFQATSVDPDGTYIPHFPGNRLMRARTLDQSIDDAIKQRDEWRSEK